jgi:NAD(P)-dependent dehydrogenase (short-subunit alcohol dehydrogenase family)
MKSATRSQTGPAATPTDDSTSVAQALVGDERRRNCAARAALITGASRGIGLAIAGVLAEERYALTMTGRDPDRLSSAADTLRANGHDILDIAADVASEADLRSLAARHLERFGRLDVLVNNAGIGLGGPIADLKTSRLDQILAINLRSTVLLTSECASSLKAAGAEHGNALVVNTSSISGKAAQAFMAAYGATKYGLVGFTQAMNRELGPHGVKFCALCPSYVDTDLTAPFREQIKPTDMIQTSDIAEAVRYLLRTSPACVVPEIQFLRPGEVL